MKYIMHIIVPIAFGFLTSWIYDIIKRLIFHKRGKLFVDKTERGFPIIKFKDRYNMECSLQESSIATEYCIWFGVNENRMHLSQAQVEELLPYLNKFVKTGEIE